MRSIDYDGRFRHNSSVCLLNKMLPRPDAKSGIDVDETVQQSPEKPRDNENRKGALMEAKKFKVLLMNPPWIGKTAYPPLGLAYLAAALDEAGIENKIVDCEALQLSLEDVKKIVQKEDADMIGITATTPSVESAFKCAQAIKEVSSSPLIMGGIHMTSMPEQSMGKKEIDIGVIGEGERTIVELAETIRDKKPLENVKEICFRDKSKIISTGHRELIDDLDSIPFPARYKLPQERYVGNPGLPKVGNIASTMTTRGCPFQCTYCSSRAIWKGRIRKRSAKNVLDEIEHLVKDYDVKAVMFKDDTFTIDTERAVSICRGMKERGLSIIWSCSARVDTVSKDLLCEMAKSGCKLIEFGLETGSERMLKVMKKGSTLEQARNAVKWCREVGIRVNGFFMIGNPGETEEEIKETVNLAKQLDLYSAQWAITRLFPGSEMFEKFKNEIGEVNNWDTFLDVNPIYSAEGTPAFLLSEVPPDILHGYLKQMTRYYSLKPRRVFENLQKIKNLTGLKRQLKAGLKLLRK